MGDYSASPHLRADTNDWGIVSDNELTTDAEISVAGKPSDPRCQLRQVVAWLTLNAMRTENLQHGVLQMQDCDTNFKKVGHRGVKERIHTLESP